MKHICPCEVALSFQISCKARRVSLSSMILEKLNHFLLTGSRRNTLLAATKFKPTPPAVSDRSMTLGNMSPCWLNSSITRVRAASKIKLNTWVSKKKKKFKTTLMCVRLSTGKKQKQNRTKQQKKAHLQELVKRRC